MRQARDFKHIIFDLGGVIINLDEKRTVKKFAELSSLPETTIEQGILHFNDFHLFEKGLITDAQFRGALRNEFKLKASDSEIDRCMNAMLLDIPIERIELLKSLTDQSVFLLSNTNEIHLTQFNKIFKETTGHNNFDGYFKKAYYSHLVHKRKPDAEIFEMVLVENSLMPNDTLFLDDNLNNLHGAESVGINTFHVKNSSQLFDLFK